VRAAVILVREDTLLLVKHVDPETGVVWWIPPGGGLSSRDNSILDCAVREVFEETGLHVELGKLVYLREFMDTRRSMHHMELFFLGKTFEGELTIDNIYGNGPDETYIKALAWLDKAQLQEVLVFPKHLAHGFWEDLSRGFPEVRHLGVQIA
jgi:ADP-ribose pyrophosphatase YjhB (NUDIX family)